MKFRDKAHRYDFHRDTLCFYPGASIHITEGVGEAKEDVLSAIVGFKFTKDTEDPYGEHDFGKVEVGGTDYYFKWEDWSGVPPEMALPAGAGPLLMTVMRADEY